MSANTEPKKENVNHITIRVKDQTGDVVIFKVKMTTKLGKLMEAYATRKGMRAADIRFLFDGQRIHSTDTPVSLEMEDEDQIDVVLEMKGGGLIDGR